MSHLSDLSKLISILISSLLNYHDKTLSDFVVYSNQTKVTHILTNTSVNLIHLNVFTFPLRISSPIIRSMQVRHLTPTASITCNYLGHLDLLSNKLWKLNALWGNWIVVFISLLFPPTLNIVYYQFSIKMFIFQQCQPNQ